MEPVLAVNHRGGAEKPSGVHLNKNNNVEWLIDLKGSEKRILVLKYQIEYPKTETLEYKEEWINECKIKFLLFRIVKTMNIIL